MKRFIKGWLALLILLPLIILGFRPDDGPSFGWGFE